MKDTQISSEKPAIVNIDEEKQSANVVEDKSTTKIWNIQSKTMTLDMPVKETVENEDKLLPLGSSKFKPVQKSIVDKKMLKLSQHMSNGNAIKNAVQVENKTEFTLKGELQNKVVKAKRYELLKKLSE